MMDRTPTSANILGSSPGNLAMSTAGTANTGQLSSLPSVYGVWAATQDAWISISQVPLSTTALTTATGYLVKNGNQPVPLIVPPYGVITAVSTSSGILGYARIGGY